MLKNSSSRSVSFLQQLSRIIQRQDVSQSADTSLSAVCTEIGKPLQIKEQLIDKSPQPNEITISVKACGVNYADILFCKGKYQVKLIPPFIPGSELSGVVVAVGDKVKNFRTGDRVGVLLRQAGSYTQTYKAIVIGDIRNTDYVWKMPDSLSFEEAAAMCISYGTAMMALSKAHLKAGETVLVTGAAGSTGIAAVELAARVFKAKVIGACGSSNKSDIILEKGASHVMEYSTVRQEVKQITQDKGVDVVFDTVGGDLFLNCLKSLAHEGRILTIGYTSGKIPSIPANLLLIKSCSAIGVVWGDYRWKKPEEFLKSVEDSIFHVKNGNIKPVVGEQFSLSQVNEAFEKVLNRKTKGKTVLKPNE